MDAISNAVKSSLTVLDIPEVSFVLKVLLIAYGAVVVPQLTVDQGHWFFNTYVRLAVVVLILWASLKDIGLSVGIAVVFFIGTWYMSRASMQQVITTGQVEGMAARILGGGYGPSLKTAKADLREQFVMQASVDEAMFNPPADDAQPVHQAAIDTIVSFKNDRAASEAQTSTTIGAEASLDRSFVPDELSGMLTEDQSALAEIEENTV